VGDCCRVGHSLRVIYTYCKTFAGTIVYVDRYNSKRKADELFAEGWTGREDGSGVVFGDPRPPARKPPGLQRFIVSCSKPDLSTLVIVQYGLDVSPRLFHNPLHTCWVPTWYPPFTLEVDQV